MNQTNPSHTFPNQMTLRAIIIIYLFIFILALTASGHLLLEVIKLKPIVLIDLLKYTLLCAIFLVLLANGLKAMPLKEYHLLRFESSVKNFKWLFTIVIVIALAAKFGFFNADDSSTKYKLVEISYLHVGLLIIAAAFCFWSHTVLAKCIEAPHEHIK